VPLHGRAQPPAHHRRRRTLSQKTVRPSSDTHEAVLAMDPLADERAPGAAVTVAPCGQWDHDPPCPLTPHHNRADRVDAGVRVRTLFAVEPELEDTVWHGVDRGLASGQLVRPDGQTTRWQLRSSQRSVVRTTRRTMPDG
jgi:hypothetical protein